MENNQNTKYNRKILSVLSVSGIIIGVLLIIISRFILSPFIQDLLFGFGLALTPSGILGLIGDYLVFGRTIEALNYSNNQLTQQVTALSISTDFLKQSSSLGLEMIYPNRDNALLDFVTYIKEQAEMKGRNGKIIIIGSSVNGLFEARLGIENILKSAFENEDCKIQILLTHPEYSHFRENQELRPPGAIEDEIFRSVRSIETIWSSTKGSKSISEIIKFYKGTPTCFMIIAGDRMLINPYPYEKEAFRSFCLSVKKVELGNDHEKANSIYQQYFRNHFESPWKRNSLPYKRYLLEGPIPDRAWNRHKRYGDVFVVQDSGKFYLSIYLTGDNDSEIMGIPKCIPYDKNDKGVVKTLQLGDTFKIKLLKVTSNTQDVNWEDVDSFDLHKERRTGQFSKMMPGNLINQYDMIGLFQEDNVSPFYHMKEAEREGLRKEHLPLFYCWLDEKPPMPSLEKEPEINQTTTNDS